MNQDEEDKHIKARISFRDNYIKRLANKYMELLSKFNTLTRNEIQRYSKEIIAEIENIEIQILKCETLDCLKEVDLKYHIDLAETLSDKIESSNEETEILKAKLKEVKKEKDYKLNCEEIAQVVNSYKSTDVMKAEISRLEDETERIEKQKTNLDSQMNQQAKRISLLVNLIDEINGSLINTEDP